MGQAGISEEHVLEKELSAGPLNQQVQGENQETRALTGSPGSLICHLARSKCWLLGTSVFLEMYVASGLVRVPCLSFQSINRVLSLPCYKSLTVINLLCN